ncbi:MAG: thioredoxin family protein [Candidatus Thorarchaeota archaeon]|nr:thioredoxin family protein [Candidatus Thorarchaeota archaeon]
MADKKTRKASTKKDEPAKIEVVLFKSDTCAFCPRAEEVVRRTIEDFGSDVFTLKVINVSENPEAAEEFGIFALPTVMIGGMSVTGIPEPDMLMKMVLGAKVMTNKKVVSK